MFYLFLFDVVYAVQLSACDFTQVGSEAVHIVGRGGASIYDPVHGTTLFIPVDSLPIGINKVEITRKGGFNTCSTLHKSMQGCSATVWLECHPPIVFTKDVHIEIPHCFVSSDTSELCFVKYGDDTDSTGYGDILSGLFPPEYPYGVIAVRSFSAYRISTKKQLVLTLARKLVRNKIFHPRHSCLQVKFGNIKQEAVTNKECINIAECSGGCNIPQHYWMGIKETSDKCAIFFSLSQCTPTGHKVMIFHFHA